MHEQCLEVLTLVVDSDDLSLILHAGLLYIQPQVVLVDSLPLRTWMDQDILVGQDNKFKTKKLMNNKYTQSPNNRLHC